MPSLIIKTHGDQGESTLWGGQLGEFHDMCVKYTLRKCVTFNFAFYFWCLDFIF